MGIKERVTISSGGRHLAMGNTAVADAISVTLTIQADVDLVDRFAAKVAEFLRDERDLVTGTPIAPGAE